MMASTRVFSPDATSVAVADVEAALTVLPARKMCNTVFHDLITGFKVLVGAMERKLPETEVAFEVVVKWLRLYLNIQAIPTTNKLRKQFEKTVVPAVTYVIASLQHKPKNLPNYHYQLLSMTEQLLQNCTPTTVEKIVKFETGIIACLWLPINFVGDFNTQMMALRLLVMLLKCADNVRQETELGKIRCPQRNEMKAKLGAAIIVANYHAGKFENTAREILNNYNMNLATDVLVYSFRCRTLQIGDKFEFFQTLSTEHFWIDLNYCPRTLTFNGRYKVSSRSHYENVSVGFIVERIELQHNILQVQFGAPATFSKELSDIKELLGMACARLELPAVEAKRLKENDFIFEYFNKVELPTQTNDRVTSSATSSNNKQADDAESIEISALQTAPQLDEILPEVAPADSSPSNLLKNIFKRSYGFLLGSSGEIVYSSGECNNQTVDSPNVEISQVKDINQLQERDVFKLPSLPKYELALHKTKAAELQPKINIKLSKAGLAQALIDESPKTSRSSDADEETSSSQVSHPISKLREKRKCFKTINRSVNKSCQENKRNTRNLLKHKPNKSITSSAPDSIAQPPKQINKVKPMSHSSQPNECSTFAAAQPNPNSIGIVDLTTFLDNGHESATVLNPNSGRNILQNVQRISVETMPASSLDTNETITPQQQQQRADVDDTLDENDVAPEQSYRNFRTRRSVIRPYPLKNEMQEGGRKSGSAAVLNPNSGCNLLQNVQRINEETEPASSLDTNEIIAPQQQSQQHQRADVYDVLDESDAEPAQSYRSFKTRHSASRPYPMKNQIKGRRGRPKKEATTLVNEDSSTSMVAATRKPRKSRKRTNTIPVSIDAKALNSVVKLQRLNINANETVYSGNIEIDLTCSENHPAYQKTVVLSDNAGKQQQISLLNSTQTSQNREGYFPGSTLSATDQENAAVSLQTCHLTVNVSNNSATAVAHNAQSEVTRCISQSYTSKSDIESKMICNENRHEPIRKSTIEKQQQPKLSIDVEQSTIKRKTFVKRYFRGSTSSESETDDVAVNANKVGAVVTDAEIEACRQHETPKNDRFDDMIILSHMSSPKQPVQPVIVRYSPSFYNDIQDDFNTTSQSECTLYRRHSGYSSNFDTDNDDIELTLQNEDAVVAVFPKTTTTTTTPPKIIAFENIATTTITKRQVSTSITTMHQRRLANSHESPTLPASVDASSTVGDEENFVLDDFTEERHELELNSNFSEISTTTTTKYNALDKYSKGIMLASSQRLLRRETRNLKQTFEQNLNADFERSLKQAKKNFADVFLDKVADLGARIFKEIEKQQQEQQEIEIGVEKILSQLNWHIEAYQRNTKRFKCFKQNTEGLLQALTKININEEIDKKFNNLLERLAESSNQLSNEQWRNFIQESTDQMLKNMSTFSQL